MNFTHRATEECIFELELVVAPQRVDHTRRIIFQAVQTTEVPSGAIAMTPGHPFGGGGYAQIGKSGNLMGEEHIESVAGVALGGGRQYISVDGYVPGVRRPGMVVLLVSGFGEVRQIRPDLK